MLIGTTLPLISYGKTVTLSWEASPTSTVTGYTVSVSLESKMGSVLLSINVNDVLTYTIHDLENKHDHYICVKAYDEKDNESICSNVVHSPAIDSLPELKFNFNVELLK